MFAIDNLKHMVHYEGKNNAQKRKSTVASSSLYFFLMCASVHVGLTDYVGLLIIIIPLYLHIFPFSACFSLLPLLPFPLQNNEFFIQPHPRHIYLFLIIPS